MELRFTPHHDDIKLEDREDGKESNISGYSAVYYRKGDSSTEYKLWDGAVERIEQGAFDRAIKEADDVRGLFNHNPDLILGRTKSGTMKLTSDERGLRYEIDAGNTTIANDVREHIKRGDVSGSSFAFTIPQGGQRWETDGDLEVRIITDVALYDSGPVTYPAYEGTSSDARTSDFAEARSSFDTVVAERDEVTKDEQAEQDKLDAQAVQVIRVRARMIELDLD